MQSTMNLLDGVQADIQRYFGPPRSPPKTYFMIHRSWSSAAVSNVTAKPQTCAQQHFSHSIQLNP